MVRLSPVFSSRLISCRIVSSPSALGTTLLRSFAVRMLEPMENPMRVWFLSAGLALMCMAQNAAAGTVLIVGESISTPFVLNTQLGREFLLEQPPQSEVFNRKGGYCSIIVYKQTDGQA